MRRAAGPFGLIIAIVLAPAAGGQAPPQTVATRIVKLAFEQTQLAVALGGRITWTNTDDRPHTVTDRGGTFDTDPIQPGERATVDFTVPGRYAFFCRINPGRMNGVVEVPSAGAPTTLRIQATDPAREGENLRFDPPALQAPTGTVLVFANVGGKPHTLTADDGSFDSGVVKPGAEGGRFAGSNATITLNEPGTFAFHCEVHPVMKGTLTVTGTAKDVPGAASSAPRTAELSAEDFAFDPKEVSIAPSGRVTWRNTGGAPHTATFDDVPLDTGQIAPGASGELTAPDRSGSYSYRCSVHPGRMRGVLVVVGQDIADPTAVSVAAAAATGGEGPPGGIPALALATGVAGAFLGGFGISAFVRGR